jgi:nitrogen fixation/metabolism regulation signal transduction histidine kinase
MKIKTKLSFGILSLFSVFLTVSIFSLFYIYKISQQNNLITWNNNLSIGYSENMIKAIDIINENKAASIFNPDYKIKENQMSNYMTAFETNLKNEENNITETGEKELAGKVRDRYDKLKSLLPDQAGRSIREKEVFYYSYFLPVINEIKSALFSISDVNMNAIVRKNATANRTAAHSYIVLSAIATVCIIVFFAFIFSFPKYIAEPIEILANNLKEVTNKNYDARMELKTNDEFGEIANGFNDLTDKLKRYEEVEAGKLLADKQRAESVVRTLNDAVIILDENENITLVNLVAENLLGLNGLNIINKKASQIASNNELLNFMVRDPGQKGSKPEESYAQLINGVKTVYNRKTDIITAYDNIKDCVAVIGYRISLSSVSKTFA